MDFMEQRTTRDTIQLQVRMEMEHANFSQKTILVEHFSQLFPDKEYTTDPESEDYKNDAAWDEFREFQRQRRLGINMTAMVCLYRRLPLEALVNLFRHEEAQHIANVAQALTISRWIHWDPERNEFVTSQLSPALEKQVFDKRYPMPMLCMPKKLVEETDSPYLTEPKSQSVLGDYSGQRTNLDTLNVLNSIPLQINPEVAKNAPDPFKDDDKFRRDSAEVFKRIENHQFYLTWQFDFRGRVYCRGYHVNAQGSDFHKHVIQFAT